MGSDQMQARVAQRRLAICGGELARRAARAAASAPRCSLGRLRRGGDEQAGDLALLAGLAVGGAAVGGGGAATLRGEGREVAELWCQAKGRCLPRAVGGQLQLPAALGQKLRVQTGRQEGVEGRMGVGMGWQG